MNLFYYIKLIVLLFKANIEEWINLDYSFIGPPQINIKKEN